MHLAINFCDVLSSHEDCHVLNFRVDVKAEIHFDEHGQKNLCRTYSCDSRCSYRYSNTSTLDISKLWGLFFTSSNYPKCKLICTSGNLDL